MKIAFIALLIVGLMAWTSIAGAQGDPKTETDPDKLVQGLKYQHGEIELKGGMAKLNVPPEFNFLGPEDAETVLVKLWHNPPSKRILGMLLPSDKNPLSRNNWAVTISYVEDGYVKDSDAAKINYDDLLKQMQTGVKEANQERAKLGYPTAELIGWATTPHYDAGTHKLYWARDLQFNDNPGHTLNYSIRILGRRGVLVLNAISSMDRLADIEQRAPQILGMVNFNDGNRYADFDPRMDKVAEYGIAALVAGGVAAKLGFFKLLWVFILAAKKFIIIGIAAMVAGIKKVFGKNKSPTA